MVRSIQHICATVLTAYCICACVSVSLFSCLPDFLCAETHELTHMHTIPPSIHSPPSLAERGLQHLSQNSTVAFKRDRANGGKKRRKERSFFFVSPVCFSPTRRKVRLSNLLAGVHIDGCHLTLVLHSMTPLPHSASCSSASPSSLQYSPPSLSISFLLLLLSFFLSDLSLIFSSLTPFSTPLSLRSSPLTPSLPLQSMLGNVPVHKGMQQ